MPEYVRITDVSPRDGLQNESAIIPASQKIQLVRLLAATGVDEIEVTSFVSPKWVPQLADAEEVLVAFTPPPFGRGSGASRGGGTQGAPDLELLPLHPDDHHKRNPLSVERSRELRNEMTFPERLLWSRLKGDQIEGHRFRRQHPLGPFIADFYCAEAALVVEVDGRTHRTPEAKQSDESRDRWMRDHGLEIERVTNDHVLQSLNAVVERIRRAVRARTSTTNAPSVPPPGPLPEGGGVKPILSVLVPNDKGFDRALAVHRSGLPLKIAVFTAASETFSKKNTNATIAETIERFRAFIPRAVAEKMQIRAYVSCAIACPFEGPIKPAAVRSVVDQLFTLFDTDESRAALDIDLGDTIGVAHPHEIEALLGEFDEDLRENQVTLHLHDTFARAASCVKAALDLGVRSFDGSVAGLGGCPYASTPERRAPGNIATETLVRAIHAAGFTTGVNLDRLTEAATFARSLALTPPPAGRGSGVSRGGGTPGTPERQ